MGAFLLRRLALTIPVVWIVVTLVFALIHLVPGDPVAQMLGEGAPAPEIQRLRHDLGLDRPILDQYKTYLMGLLKGDLGISFRNQQPVVRSISERYPATMELTLAAILVSLVIAIPAAQIAVVAGNA